MPDGSNVIVMSSNWSVVMPNGSHVMPDLMPDVSDGMPDVYNLYELIKTDTPSTHRPFPRSVKVARIHVQ